MSSKQQPDRPVVMGRILAPFGVKGWIKVETYTAASKALLDHPEWWLECGGIWRQHRVEDARVHGKAVVAKLESCDDRDEAARMKGASVAVPREALPQAGEGEYYWADLIGLRVSNEQQDDFGVVARIIETGANDVLVVEGERERLIPFIAEVVKRVDLAAGVIIVDWDATY